ncbi:MAG: adenylyltransferase/cytidyltransferase family protein [Telmatospirillum sp.]|nr:adenylyltransferase/cytidyltransferase family protein [Telmatospirillum sp.]
MATPLIDQNLQSWIKGILSEIDDLSDITGLSPEENRKIVFVSGDFNVVHPGHLRLLNFAADCGAMLIVGVLSDALGNPLLGEDLRLEGVRSIGVVDYAFILRVPPEQFIRALKPDVVVKGKEHEQLFNAEQEAVESYSGKLLFSSGDVRFSSLDLLQRELRETNFSSIRKPQDYPLRHGFQIRELADVVRDFARLKVTVVGDLIVDEYISCDPLGMSQEDPTLVVSPVHTDRFIGGAGIVAAHARGLGATVTYLGVTGRDATAKFAEDVLTDLGVNCILLTDDSRPTTLKQRYRASNKTLLRVSHLRQHDIGALLIAELEKRFFEACKQTDLVIFSDFNYGALPQSLVDRLCSFCREKNIMTVADSQASSQIGDVSRFKATRLLTPTEREARLAVRDFRCGLVVLAETLRRQAETDVVLLTLGAEGLLIQAPPELGPFATDRLPAFNTAPKDVSGAGDSLLTCTSMAMAVGADIWRASYLGSVAAACQVGRIGNIPLTAEELVQELAS